MTIEYAATLVKEMPAEFDVEELIERLLFVEKIEVARQEIKDGKSYTHSEVKDIIDGWHK